MCPGDRGHGRSPVLLAVGPSPAPLRRPFARARGSPARPHGCGRTPAPSAELGEPVSRARLQDQIVFHGKMSTCLNMVKLAVLGPRLSCYLFT